jgi:tRNA-dihydrouridine synthase C
VIGPGAAWAARERVARRPDEPGLFLALAPMDGVTDAVWRELMTSRWGAGSGISLCVSEFLRVTREPLPEAVLRRDCPELSTGGATTSGVPVFVQLLGSDPDCMAATAARAAGLGAPGIDLNFGCPAKTVNRSDGGATLLRDPCRIEAVTAAVRAATPAEVPVTVKVRLGWDSAERTADIARAAEAGGATWLTIHARTREQGYRPPVDWAAIGRARAEVRIPVVANGDIAGVEDLVSCAALTGCSAFMIGRGAVGRPDLFRRLRGLSGRELSTAELRRLLLDYSDRLLGIGLSPPRVLGRIKQWLRLGAPFRPDLARWFDTAKRAPSLPDALALLGADDQLPGAA